MRKIRILTFWGVPNHGCFFQAYALQKVVKKICNDDDVRQIAYLGKKHYNFYYNSPLSVKKIFNLKKEHELRKYINHYKIIPNTENKQITEFPNEKIDILILGSDIIWDYNSDLILGEECLFGGGVDSVKKISYAPSFGRGFTGNSIPNYVKNDIKRLDAISVRDEESAQIVGKITGRIPEIVLDPTLLYDFSDDIHIKNPHEERPYIVVYGSDFTDRQIENLRQYSRKYKLEIVNLEFMGKNYKWCDRTIGRDELSPFEWLGYFKYSEFVMTSTFHGLVFGLIFNKKLIFNPTEFIMKKATKLINDLDISDILLNNDSFEKADKNWKYSLVNEKIKNMREESMQYLIKNLK